MSGWRVDLSQPQPHLWSTSESPTAFHLIQAIWFTHATEGWEILEEKRWMEYALRHPGYTESIFPPYILSFFFSYTTISQSCGHNGGTVTPLSLPQALPPFLFLPLYRHRSLLPCLPTRHTSTSPPRLCQGVSEWWSFSGPHEWSCGFSVPHIRSRALAFCMLQEFGLAVHQALTTSSLTLTAASAELDKLPEAHSQYAVWNYADVSLFTFVFINFYKNICAFLRHPFRKCSLTNSEWKWLPICMIHSKS